ncbi:MAG: cupredoxin domain-containing protein [Elusimicrobiota bacterium]
MGRLKLLLIPIFLLAVGCENNQVDTGTELNKSTAAESMGEARFSGTFKDGVREISMSAYQFAFDPDEVLVKKGEKVRLVVKSTDVTHGIAIEDLDIDRKLPPGEEVVIEFTPQKSGTLHFHCSVYCGSGHGRMHGEIIVKK